MTSYGPYDTDNLTNGINPSQLGAEITASSIITALDRIDTSGGSSSQGVITGGTYTLVFKTELSSGDKETLDGSTDQAIEDPPSEGSLLAGHDAQPTDDTVTVDVANRPEVEVTLPDGLAHERIYGFSINLCDKTTWRGGAVEVVNELVGTGDGVTTQFNLAKGSAQNEDERIFDLSHGKTSDENDIPCPSGSNVGLYRDMGNGWSSTGSMAGQVPQIKVGGVEKTERVVYAESGGDYEIDYHTGQLTFYEAPAQDAEIRATYWYIGEDGPACVAIVPGAGRKVSIQRIEVQSTTDVVMNDSLINNVYLGTPPGGTPARRPTVIKNMFDLINWAHGSYVQIPAQGGTIRGTQEAINIHRVEYLSSIPLLSSLQMYLRIFLENGIEFGGTWATIVIYGIDEAE